MTDQKTLSRRAWTEMVMLGTIWGASFLSIRIALDEIGAFTIVAHRVFWAALVLWGVVLIMRLDVPRSASVWIGFLGMGVLNNIIPFSLMAWGQQFIPTGLTSILNAATAVFGVVTAAVFFADERLTLRKGFGVVLGFVGVLLAVGVQYLQSFNIESLAQIAVLLGTLSYALASVWARKKLSGLAPQVAAAGMLTTSSLIAVPVAWMIEGPFKVALETETILSIGYFAILGTAGAYLLYYRVLAMAGSGNLMLVTLLIPPVAIVLGAWVRDEALGANAYIGFAILALGLLFIDGRVFRRRRVDPLTTRR